MTDLPLFVCAIVSARNAEAAVTLQRLHCAKCCTHALHPHTADAEGDAVQMDLG